MNSLAVYRNFDDDALAALASTGLVRRAAKDVEAGKVAWIDAPAGIVGADGQRVRVDGGGPARAVCDCPAPGICKHILAAAIWLREATAPGAEEVDVLAEVLALDPAALLKAAGVVATRKAAALFAEAPAAQLTALPGALLIAVPELELACRFIAGAGFAGMVSEAPAASRAAVHLLALACAWRAHGQSFPWPAATAPDLAAPALTAPEQQFVVRVRQLIHETCAGGWSHVSDVMPAQLRALAVSARVDAFPRLAGMLRTLAGTTALLAGRDLHADERQAIALAARIHALCHALGQANGATLDALRGAARRTFDGSDALTLLPLGAHWWEGRGGARGLTVSFWDPVAARVMQAVLARRDGSDAGFGREGAWSTHTLWPGAGAAATLGAGTLALDGARVSFDHNLSFSAETRAQVLAPWRVDDPRWLDAGIHSWRALAGLVQASAGLQGTPLSAVLLRPAACDPPRLDEARQLLHWTLRDAAGAALTLTLPADAQHHERIEHIEAWATSGTPILGVVARVARELTGMALEPVGIIIATGGVVRAVALDFEGPPASALRSLMLDRLTRMLRPKAGGARPAPPAARRFEWIIALQETIEHKAMTGRLHLPGAESTQLAHLQAYLRATGVDVVADAVQRYLAQPGAEHGLTLHYLCQVCAELEMVSAGVASPGPQLSAP